MGVRNDICAGEARVIMAMVSLLFTIFEFTGGPFFRVHKSAEKAIDRSRLREHERVSCGSQFLSW